MGSVKKTKHFYDYSLVFTIIFLTVFGLVMIYSASSYMAQVKKNNSAYYMIRQGAISTVGFIIMLFISRIDYKKIIKLFMPLYFIAIFLMIWVNIFGREFNGKKRWIGISQFTFQPTEIAKIAIIIFFSVYIVKIGKEINTWKGLLKILIWDAPLAALVGHNNLSSGIIILGIPFVMSFIATNKKAIYVAILGVGLVLLKFVGPIAKTFLTVGLLKPYQYSRIMVWLNPSAYATDGGYQVLQGLYAIGSGGLFGKGLGESMQKFIIPEAENDMIFSIICEELGLFGAVSIVFVFLFMIYRFLVIANSAPDLYGSLIVIGVMAHISIQVILNIAVVTNVIPNTGITLPFISYGGTSVLFLMMEMGLVLGVSRQIPLEH